MRRSGAAGAARAGPLEGATARGFHLACVASALERDPEPCDQSEARSDGAASGEGLARELAPLPRAWACFSRRTLEARRSTGRLRLAEWVRLEADPVVSHGKRLEVSPLLLLCGP